MAKEKKVETPAVEKSKTIVEHYFDVIVKPIVTEKTMALTKEQNKVVVEVNANANKDEIKDAFEAVFAVKVAKVNIINTRPRTKRVGRYEGQVSGFKKAIVKLAAGQSLDIYQEGTETK